MYQEVAPTQVQLSRADRGEYPGYSEVRLYTPSERDLAEKAAANLAGHAVTVEELGDIGEWQTKRGLYDDMVEQALRQERRYSALSRVTTTGGENRTYAYVPSPDLTENRVAAYLDRRAAEGATTAVRLTSATGVEGIAAYTTMMSQYSYQGEIS